MSRSMILEAMYEVIKDSTEWGVGEKDYGMFVDGIVAMTEAMLEKNELVLHCDDNKEDSMLA